MSQAGQEVVYLGELFKGLGHPQKKPTEIWEDNASCIMMSENPTNRDRSRHVDVKVHYLRDLVRDDHVKLVKCSGTQNVSDVLTKSLAGPAFEKHREHMWGTICGDSSPHMFPICGDSSTVSPFQLSLVLLRIRQPLSWPMSLTCQNLFLLLTSLGKLSVQVVKVSLSTHKGRVK